MKAGKVCALVGGAVFVLGLVVGLIPVSAAGADCGSAFAGANTFGLALDGAADACAGVRSLVRIPAIALLVIGGLLGVGGAIAANPMIIGVTPKNR